MSEHLPRRERLRGQKRFDELFAGGAVGKARFALVRSLPNGLDRSRAAVVAGRKTGNAVRRNRLRRRLRAAYRLSKGDLPGGVDWVLVARAGAEEAPWATFLADVMKACRRSRESDRGSES